MCNLRYHLLTWVIRGVDWSVSLSITCCLLNRCGNCRWYRSTVAFLIAKVSRATLVSARIRSVNTFLKQKQSIVHHRYLICHYNISFYLAAFSIARSIIFICSTHVAKYARFFLLALFMSFRIVSKHAPFLYI